MVLVTSGTRTMVRDEEAGGMDTGEADSSDLNPDSNEGTDEDCELTSNR